MSGLYLTLALVFTVFPIVNIAAKIYQKSSRNWILELGCFLSASTFYGLLLNSCQ